MTEQEGQFGLPTVRRAISDAGEPKRSGRQIRRALLGWTAALAGLLAFGAGTVASALSAGANLDGAGWELLVFAGDGEGRFIGRSDGVIEVTADSSAAFLYREIDEMNRKMRYLSWRWRVDATMPPTDLSRPGADDRPLALHLVFPHDPEETGLFARLSNSLIAEFVGPAFTGRLVTYTWGGTGARGDRLRNPHLDDDGVMIILRPGDAQTGKWFHERIDIAADFERAFGREAVMPHYIAISADGDDTGTKSRSYIAGIEFSAK